MLKRIETNICNLKQHVRLHNIFLSSYILIKHLIQGYTEENPYVLTFSPNIWNIWKKIPLQKRYFVSLNMFIINIGCRIFIVAIIIRICFICHWLLIKQRTNACIFISNLFNNWIRSTVKACNKEAGPNFYGKLYLWRHKKTIILQVVKMNQ